MTRLAIVLSLGACSASAPPVDHAADAARPDGRVVVLGDGAEDTPFTHYRATATSAVVPFGGTPYCNYTVQLQDLAVDVIAHGPAEVTTATVAYHRVETAPGCTYAPAPPNDSYFDHRGGPTADTGNGFAPALVGRATNSPIADGTAAITLAGGGGAVDLTFRRTDTGDPKLDWTVTVNGVALAQASCAPGSIACYGGALEGAVFSCNADGQTLTPTTVCANGCADAISCR